MMDAYALWLLLAVWLNDYVTDRWILERLDGHANLLKLLEEAKCR